MIKLIVTASDELYQTLSAQVRSEGHLPWRARDVLQGFNQASSLAARDGDQPTPPGARDHIGGVIVDMSLHAADTLLEALHTRQSTSTIPLLAVRCDGRPFPLALRLLCTDIIEADVGPPAGEPRAGES